MHYVIGHPPRGSTASPTLVYAGQSGSAARAAAEANTSAAEIEIISHVVGVRKRNANFQPPAVTEVTEVTEVPSQAKPKGKK
jgi:hypothetical protein